MRIADLVFALLLAAPALQGGAENAWPPLPKSAPIIRDLTKTVKANSVEVSRDGKQVACISKIDKDSDGRFDDFVFSAFVSNQLVVAVTRIGGTNESALFFSFDDVMVMTVRLPESGVVALAVRSEKHNYYEIFARQPEGYYWPADEAQRSAVDKSVRAGARTMSLTRQGPGK